MDFNAWLLAGGVVLVLVELFCWSSALHYHQQAQNAFQRGLWASVQRNHNRAFSRLLWCVAVLTLVCAGLLYLVLMRLPRI